MKKVMMIIALLVVVGLLGFSGAEEQAIGGEMTTFSSYDPGTGGS